MVRLKGERIKEHWIQNLKGDTVGIRKKLRLLLDTERLEDGTTNNNCGQAM